VTEDSDTIKWSGAGSSSSKWKVDAIIDPLARNLLSKSSSGLLVDPNDIPDFMRILGGNYGDGPSPGWVLSGDTYEDWGGTDFTRKSFTKVGSDSETDLLILFAVSGFLIDTGQTGSCVVDVGVEVGAGNDVGTRPFGLSWPTAVNADGSQMYEHYTNFVAESDVPAGALNIQLRGKIRESDHQFKADLNSGFAFLVIEVPASVTFS
jgi:hypothetical protein